jgi:hypothetical protein
MTLVLLFILAEIVINGSILWLLYYWTESNP